MKQQSVVLRLVNIFNILSATSPVTGSMCRQHKLEAAYTSPKAMVWVVVLCWGGVVNANVWMGLIC